MRFAKLMAYLALIVVSCILIGCATSQTEVMTSSLLEAIKQDPENPDLHARLARLYWTRYEETKNPGFLYVAANELKEVIRLKPDLHWGHCTLGLVYSRQGKDDLAIFEAKEAVKLDPECPLSHQVLGILYAGKTWAEETCYDDEMIELGIKELKELIRLRPDDAYAHNLLGSLYRQKGLYELSVFELKEALRLFNNPETHRLLAAALYQRGEYEAAINEYEEALRLNPKLVGIHTNIAWVHFVNNRFDDAVAEIRTFQKSSRQPLVADNVLSQYLSMRQTGEGEKARQMLEEYYAKTFKGKALDLYRLQYYLGKISETELVGKARHRCDRAALCYFIGYNYFLQGDKQKATEYFQKTLDTNVFGFGVYTGAIAMLERLKKQEVSGASRIDSR